MSEKTDQSTDDFPIIYQALIEEIRENYNKTIPTQPASQINQPIISASRTLSKFEIAKDHEVRMFYKEGRIVFYHYHRTNDMDLAKIPTIRVALEIDIANPHFFRKCNKALRLIMKSIQLHIAIEETPDTDFPIEVMVTENN